MKIGHKKHTVFQKIGLLNIRCMKLDGEYVVNIGHKGQVAAQYSGHKRQVLLYRRVHCQLRNLLSTDSLVAQFLHHLVMISINLSETTHFEHCQSETKSETIFFQQFSFSAIKSFLQFFSQTEFCLGLDFVSD